MARSLTKLQKKYKALADQIGITRKQLLKIRYWVKEGGLSFDEARERARQGAETREENVLHTMLKIDHYRGIVDFFDTASSKDKDVILS